MKNSVCNNTNAIYVFCYSNSTFHGCMLASFPVSTPQLFFPHSAWANFFYCSKKKLGSVETGNEVRCMLHVAYSIQSVLL